MTNMIIMLVLLMGPRLMVRLKWSLAGRPYWSTEAAAWGLGAVFAFTAMGHFIQTAQLALMLPEWTPVRILVVQATGLLEVLVAVGLFTRKLRRAAGWAALILLVAFFPANVYAAWIRLPFGGYEWGMYYLLARGPLQALLVFWAWWFVVRRLPGRRLPRGNLRG